MLTEQKDEGLENRACFGRSYSPSSVSWRAVTSVEPRLLWISSCHRAGKRWGAPENQFMVLAAAEPGRGGTFPCNCVSAHPKTTSAKREVSHTKMVEQIAFKRLQLFPSFVSVGMLSSTAVQLPSFKQK